MINDYVGWQTLLKLENIKIKTFFLINFKCFMKLDY